jgi:hypothetical protein
MIKSTLTAVALMAALVGGAVMVACDMPRRWHDERRRPKSPRPTVKPVALLAPELLPTEGCALYEVDGRAGHAYTRFVVCRDEEKGLVIAGLARL